MQPPLLGAKAGTSLPCLFPYGLGTTPTATLQPPTLQPPTIATAAAAIATFAAIATMRRLVHQRFFWQRGQKKVDR